MNKCTVKAAAKLFLQYAVGKPAPVQEPDRVEIDEWQLRREGALGSAEVMETLNLATAEIGNKVVGVIQPAQNQRFAEPFVAELRGETPKGSAQKAWMKMMLEEEAEFEPSYDGSYGDEELETGPRGETLPPSRNGSYGAPTSAA